jgi:hypothetical protein
MQRKSEDAARIIRMAEEQAAGGLQSTRMISTAVIELSAEL